MGTQAVVDADREWRKAAKLAAARRKSPAQLDAEIAASLRGSRPKPAALVVTKPKTLTKEIAMDVLCAVRSSVPNVETRYNYSTHPDVARDDQAHESVEAATARFAALGFDAVKVESDGSSLGVRSVDAWIYI